jgi:UDP-N-acetylglucosamine--N-acetylmuramyl-(pentapeptide) pyrophosphoryl-undecaprenol N-acetylglucosamine transferase
MKKRIFISSGGTGGHIIPARCLAEKLVNENFEVLFFGDKKYLNYIKKEDQFKSKIINSSQLVKEPLAILAAAIKITFGFFKSLFFILFYRPKYLIAFGGYATFPLLIAAVITKTKIILHEQNSHLGKVNRIFAGYAEKIALSFLQTSGIQNNLMSKTVFVGNPVRKEIVELNKLDYLLPNQEEKPRKNIKENNKMGYNILLQSDFNEIEETIESVESIESFNILVLGGSGGAKIFSEILPKAFFNLDENLKSKINITQQCRKEFLQSTFTQYRDFNLSIKIQTFFEDMSEIIRKTHLVIARSGASSVFEFCAAKKPMILIPFEASADNHQKKNARYFEKENAAIVIEEKDFTINKAMSVIKALLEDKELLKVMSKNCGKLAVLDSTEKLVKLIN